MDMFMPAPEPPTRLGLYRKLAPRAAINVSPILLGGMSIGDQWNDIGMGSMTKESSFALLDGYFQGGGNFIDTANQYQSGSSEAFIGEWAESRGIRDQLILATKYTNNSRLGDKSLAQRVNYCGNNMKSLRLGIENSLKRLRTSYIDILYVHYWDNETDAEEMIDGLHNLVVAGKVLYLGVSSVPPWLVMKANAYARYHGKTPFTVYQAPWSVLNREIEREILPMCIHEGIAVVAYNVLAGGHIRSDEEEERRRKTGENGRSIMGPWERTPEERAVCLVLERIAKEVGAKSITAIAIAYVMHKAPYVFPIVGGRKIEQLMANVEALHVSLTPEHIKAIEDAKPFHHGYPWEVSGYYGEIPFLIAAQAKIIPQPAPAIIKPGSN